MFFFSIFPIHLALVIGMGGIGLSFLVFRSPSFSSYPRKYLSLFFLALGFHWLNMYAMGCGLLLLNLSPCFAVLYLPLLFLTLRVCLSLPISNRTHFLHALPLGLALYWSIQDYLYKSEGLTLESWITGPILLQMVVYLYFCGQLLRKYREILLQTRSFISQKRRHFFYFSFLSFSLLVLGVFLEYLFSFFHLGHAQDIAVTIIFMLMLFYLIYAHHIMVFYPKVFLPIQPSKPIFEPNPNDQINLSDLLARANELMVRKELFLEPRLKIGRLAQELGCSEREISQAINQMTKRNFFDFVNRFRVDHFCELLKQNPKMSILEGLFEAGFQSKSSFNSAFKKVKHETPSSYLRKPSKES